MKGRSKTTDMMKKRTLIPFVFFAAALCGCADEPFTKDDPRYRNEEELPIEFVMEFPSMVNETQQNVSRVQKEQFAFEEGDVIHVSATFTLIGGSTSVGYDCLELRDGQWASKENDDPNTPAKPMTWPWDAEKATFRVYYLAHSTGILVENTERLLDRLCNEADPVYAEAVDIPYGGAVHLTFNHLCSKLTVTGLKSGEKGFWLQKTGLQDAFSLSRNSADESLDFKFFESTETLRPGLDRRVTGTSDGEGSVTFYLAPGDYSDMSITYPYGLAYLTLTDIAELENLEANTAYMLNINPGSGNVDEADENDWWPDPDDNEDDVKLDTPDINGLLQAIHDGKEYTTQAGTPILAIDENGTVLLRNLDFQDNPFKWQVLPNGTVFDGKYHYIKNVKGSALFSQINGRVSNLGIAGGKIDQQADAENTGLLAPTSSVSAVMNNLRLKNIAITVMPTLIDDVCNIGTLIGNNSGTIIGIELGGTISVHVESANAPGRVHIGGLVGQTSGSISNVALLDDNDPVHINVTCDCQFPEGSDEGYAEGDRYVGGLAGLSTGRISDCTLSATVSSADTQGVLMYTGGLIGMLRGAEEGQTGSTSTVSLSNSIGACDVTGGLAYSLDNTINGEGRSYTGGLIGYTYCATSITDCKSLGKVYGHDYQQAFHPYDNTYYALGGAFGQIYGANTSITGVDARSEIVTELAFTPDVLYCIGLFAGRSDIDHANGNSNHNSGNYDFTGEIGNIHY